MARKIPPQHRADTPGVFIARNDSSFDADRVARELLLMGEQGIDAALHPVERYYAGATRYDLQAPDMVLGQVVRAADYFRRDTPEEFVLRRLDWEQWHRVLGLIEGGQFAAAQLLAARLGVAEVRGSPLKLQGAAAGLLTHEDMQRLFEADSSLPSTLGFAVWRHSRPLTDAEKKA